MEPSALERFLYPEKFIKGTKPGICVTVFRLRGVRKPVIADGTDRFKVVLTFSRDKFRVRGWSVPKIRQEAINLVRDYCIKFDIEVCGGPWLDDNQAFDHPHVNLTIRADIKWSGVIDTSWKHPFEWWNLEYGRWDMKPIKGWYEKWLAYASRNDRTCRDYRDGLITFYEAQYLWKNKAQGWHIVTPDDLIIL